MGRHPPVRPARPPRPAALRTQHLARPDLNHSRIALRLTSRRIHLMGLLLARTAKNAANGPSQEMQTVAIQHFITLSCRIFTTGQSRFILNHNSLHFLQNRREPYPLGGAVVARLICKKCGTCTTAARRMQICGAGVAEKNTPSPIVRFNSLLHRTFGHENGWQATHCDSERN